MKLKTTIILALTLCYCEVFSQIELTQDIGKNKRQIEEVTKNGNITYGINDKGVAYLMDSSWDGFETWYFDDNSICIAVYMVFREGKGLKYLFDLKLKISKKAEKMDDNTYLLDGFYFKFSNPDSGIGLVVSKDKF